MEQGNTFYIEKDGTRYVANILTNFEVFKQKYCIYTVPFNEKEEDVYCARVVGNNLVKIDNESELKLTNKVVKEFVASIKKHSYLGGDK